MQLHIKGVYLALFKKDQPLFWQEYLIRSQVRPGTRLRAFVLSLSRVTRQQISSLHILSFKDWYYFA
jgi:hypothetical protein